MKYKKIVVGAINWDTSLPPDTFFGYHSSKSLGPEKYRQITPYYADILGKDKICYHKRTMEEYEKEMQYAIDAGIDYFAYCWYGESKKKQDIDWQGNLWELSYARKMHSKSSLKNKLKMCAILGVGAKEKELSEDEVKALCEEMKEEYYQKIDGRPLIYIFDGHKNKVKDIIKNACEKYGTKEPYFSYMCWDTKEEDREALAKADSLSAYSLPMSAKNYNEYIKYMTDDFEEKKKANINIIPRFPIGWNPGPRMDNPIPWYSYAEEDYLSTVTSDDLKKGADILLDWILGNPESTKSGHIIIFAWNEFEEGSHICPTYDKEGKGIDTERVEIFREIIKEWKEKL